MNNLSQIESSSAELSTSIKRTTCPYCGVGCGVVAEVKKTAIEHKTQVTGDDKHPSNFGKLCIKGSNLADTLGLKTRLLTPMLGRGTQRLATDWNSALDTVADKFQQCIAQYGPESIAFYVSGQLLTEDYYVANKFVKGYLGTANIDTNSRLCMSSAVAGYKRAFGEDLVPASYHDFEHTDMVVLVGSNTAWCHPVLYQRIMKAKENRDIFVVVIDPRFTSTCEAADLHLPIMPGQDVALFNGLLQYLLQNGYRNDDFIGQHTQDLQQAIEASSSEASIEVVAKRTGISSEKLTLFFEKFAQNPKVMTLFSMGINQSSQGVDKVNSIINCHLLTGKIGQLGSAPFSMTGQPNAMGGREVGGLANLLAAHLDLDNPKHQQLVQTFWQSPQIATKAGLKAVDLFEAVESGKIKAIWIMATNPVVSLPNADQVKRALEKCPCVVVSDVCQDTDTTQYADVLLPALAWGEKDGTVTNSERRISRQKPFLAAPGDAKADWWIISEVAKRLGFKGFDYSIPYDIFMEHVSLSACHNGTVAQRDDVLAFRYFNLQGLQHLNEQQYQQLSPIQWPVWQAEQDETEVSRVYADGQFSHVNKKARFVATRASNPKNQPSQWYPLILNTGRIRDQWHTMSRTGLSANLSSHRAEPYCEIHPHDALKYGVKDGELLEIKSLWGSCVLRVLVSENIRQGQVFAPIHWSDQMASDARIGRVVNPDVDAISNQPEFKHTPVMIQPFYTRWQGVLSVRHGYENHIKDFIKDTVWWTKIAGDKFTRYELADRQKFSQITKKIKPLLVMTDEQFEWLNLEDQSAHISHNIVLKDNQLIASLYIAPKTLLPDRDWLAALFKRDKLSAMHRKALLAGQAMSALNSEGPLVCSCFKVGKKRIVAAIKENNLQHEKQVTACLKAGGNCGSCLPEIRGLIKLCQATS